MSLLWALQTPSRLSPTTQAILSNPATPQFVSVVSLWELTIKDSLGKLTLPEQFLGRIESSLAQKLPITLAHLEALRILPHFHRDPFDRMLVAQAQTDGLTLITVDPHIRRYAVSTLYAFAA